MYLLLGRFQCVLVSERHAISADCRNILSSISSRVKAPLNISSPPTFWYISRKVSGDFVCISSPKVKFWIMHGLSLFSVWIGDAVCECVGVCGLGDFNFTVLFCELFIGCLM